MEVEAVAAVVVAVVADNRLEVAELVVVAAEEWVAAAEAAVVEAHKLVVAGVAEQHSWKCRRSRLLEQPQA